MLLSEMKFSLRQTSLEYVYVSSVQILEDQRIAISPFGAVCGLCVLLGTLNHTYCHLPVMGIYAAP